MPSGTMDGTVTPRRGASAAVHRISDTLNVWTEHALFALMTLMIVVVMAQIVWRFFFQALTWTEEVSCFLLVLASLAGTAVAFKRGSHIAITMLYDKLDPARRKVLATFINLLGTGFFVIVAWFGASLMKSEASQTTPALHLSMSWIYLMYPVLGSIIVVHQLDGLLRTWEKQS